MKHEINVPVLLAERDRLEAEVERLRSAIEKHRDSPYVPGDPSTVEAGLLHARTRDALLYKALNGKESQ